MTVATPSHPKSDMRRALSLTEGAQERAAKRARQTVQAPGLNMSGWRVAPYTEARKWVLREPDAPSAGALPFRVPRAASMCDILLFIFTPALLSSLTTALGVEMSARRCFEVFAIRIYIQFLINPARRGTSSHPLEDASHRFSWTRNHNNLLANVEQGQQQIILPCCLGTVIFDDGPRRTNTIWVIYCIGRKS